MMLLESDVASQSCVYSEYSTWGGSSVKGQRVTHSNHLWSAGQEVVDPPAQGGVQTQVKQFGGQSGGDYSVKC